MDERTDPEVVVPEPLDDSLRAAAAETARTPYLLVACDYDGTLSPVVDDPATARPLPEAVAAVRALAALPQTTVAVVSGRALRDLAALSRLPAEVHLVGSHGSEFDIGFVDALSPDQQQLRTDLVDAVTGIVRRQRGVQLEIKPASVAIHTRAAPAEVAERVLTAVRHGPASWPEIQVTSGKKVMELSIVRTNKGMALDELRTRLPVNAVVYLGDDVTDESAFARLHGPDLGVKVGPGETQASHRIENPVDAVRLLGFLLIARRRWLFGERAVPIERHSMLSNGRTIALVAPDARINWLCYPKADSSAVFAALLGDTSAGHFTISSERGGLPLGQRYRRGTMTVETRWSGLTVADSLDHHADGPSLIRILTGTDRATVEFAPRPEFGQIHVRLQRLAHGLLVLGPNEPIVLYSPGIEWEIVQDGENESAQALVDLAELDGAAILELRMCANHLDPEERSAFERQASTEARWKDWSASLKLPTRARDEVLRSALTLRGLCFQPAGSILAAATCSLPEEIGGVRNWDYRYCWLRDASMTARVLLDLGSADEAEALLRWTMKIVEGTAGHPERLHPLYNLDGSDLGPEAVIETLPGYAGSRPVRVGNAANRQVQLDVFGPVADLICELARFRSPGDLDFALMEAMVSAVARRWHEPDNGLWEARRAPEHYVYSKVMCWYTVDRGIAMYEHLDQPVPDAWRTLRHTIAEDVLTRGWRPERGAYTIAYGDPAMDAAALWVGLSGLLADDDERFLATVLKVEADLRSGPTVYRYRWNDGLPGAEGGFHLCTTWLIEAYLRTGRRTDAEELFAQLLDCAGPTGLLSEEYDPENERGLGNHPQAYSHLGLIRCALLLDRTA
ncbi:MAG: trehalose-phosphatase [Dactylosporangium sp.]|nr:trehalose-phosphatase [Dactylosporangium sp.]NNJ63560.1 trehalose-phosphatase [Dactylosporangium sp.]